MKICFPWLDHLEWFSHYLLIMRSSTILWERKKVRHFGMWRGMYEYFLMKRLGQDRMKTRKTCTHDFPTRECTQNWQSSILFQAFGGLTMTGMPTMKQKRVGSFSQVELPLIIIFLLFEEIDWNRLTWIFWRPPGETFRFWISLKPL